MGKAKDDLGHDPTCQCPQHGGPDTVNELEGVDLTDDSMDPGFTLYDGDPA